MSQLDDRAPPAFAPLQGMRVIDFSSNMAGPYASMILAQLGADIIKVEPPQGDDARAWPPHVDGMSMVHRHVNAGKRGIVLDLKSSKGQDVARRLAATADVVLQSMRPGVAERIGIDDASLRAANPGLLYYDLSAFGAGPVGQGMPGYDPLVQAHSGIMAMNGHDGSPLSRCAPSVIDLGTGQWIAMGVLAAALSAERGRPVGRMETALIDTAFSLVPYQASTAKLTGDRPPRAGSGNPIAAPYECFRTRDAEILIAAPNQRLWTKLVGALDAPHLLTDPRYLTVKDRSAHVRELSAEINAILVAADADTWVETLTKAGLPVSRVSGLEEAVAGRIARERGSFLPSDSVPLVRLPWMIDGQPVPWTRRAPRLGEHTAEVLQELGYSGPDIEDIVVASNAGGAQPADRAQAT